MTAPRIRIGTRVRIVSGEPHANSPYTGPALEAVRDHRDYYESAGAEKETEEVKK